LAAAPEGVWEGSVEAENIKVASMACPKLKRNSGPPSGPVHWLLAKTVTGQALPQEPFVGAMVSEFCVAWTLQSQKVLDHF
jgi:hypothetical protein